MFHGSASRLHDFKDLTPPSPRPTLPFAVLVAFLLGGPKMGSGRIYMDLQARRLARVLKKDNRILGNRILGMSWITSQAVSEDCCLFCDQVMYINSQRVLQCGRVEGFIITTPPKSSMIRMDYIPPKI